MSQSESTYPWLELFKAQTAKQEHPVAPTKPIGRPNRRVRAKKSTVWLTASDRKAIESAQVQFSQLAGKKLSLGTTFGLLAQIIQERANSLDLEGVEDLEALFAVLIGEPEPEATL